MITNILMYPEILEIFNFSCSQILNYRVQKIFPELKKVYILLKTPDRRINWNLATVYESARKGYDKVFEEYFKNEKIMISTLFENLFIGGSIKILDIIEKRIPKNSFHSTYISLENLVKYNNISLTMELSNRDYKCIDYNELAMYSCKYDNLLFFKKFSDTQDYQVYLDVVYKYDSINIFNYMPKGELLSTYDIVNIILYSTPNKCEIAKQIIKNNNYHSVIETCLRIHNKTFLISS